MVQLSLKAARVKAGLTQEEMAIKLGTNRVTYGHYENYETPMRIDTATKFSEIVGLSMDNIIFLNKNYT